jgi:hypothetical protein
MPDAAEPSNVLRLVLCTQPRSNPVAFGSDARVRYIEVGSIKSHF